jgi:polyisoprenoid-binding protein YceI
MISTRDRQTRKLRSTLAALCCALLLATSALAQKPQTPFSVTLDPATTNIHWTLNTTIHTVHGTFKLRSGTFRIDPATGDASGLVVVDATSGESGDPARDKRMHSAILESPQYPTIIFRPTHVDGPIDLTAAGPVTVHGIFTLHGQDHPLQITVNLHPQPSAVALAAHFTIPFVAWGLKDPSTFVFRSDKEVTLDIDAAIAPTPDPARPR